MDKSSLTPEQQIEYYLGKDRLPNVHWQPKIPHAWSIKPRQGVLDIFNDTLHNTTVKLENIDYYFNNLGYRSTFDYSIDELKKQNIVLLLGDSDTSGRGVEFNDMYSTKMQRLTDYCIVNLGVPGLSGDGMARIGTKTILALGSAVKHVCVLWPVQSLREFVSKNFESGVHTTSDHLPYTDWWDHIDWVSNNYNYQKNHNLIKSMSAQIGASYHELIINRYDPNTAIKYNQINNIFSELTPESHTAIANYYLRKINNQPSLFQEMQS